MSSQNEYAIEMNNITKIFGELVANDDITLKVKKGEIHALIGENGAGKSTLMSILFGLYEPTKGEIFVNGKSEYISNPIKANKLGIGMVHQHFKLVDIFTVLDNIALGHEKITGKVFLDRTSEIREISKIATKYNLEVDFRAKVSNISVGMQQRVEILKILYRGADILVFDEPTAVLTPQEIEGLLNIMLDLKKDGKTIIFISHKLDEVKKLADSATVIRKGKVVDTFSVKDKTQKEIAEAMVGRQLIEIKNTGVKPQDQVLLKVENLSIKKKGITKVMALDNFNVEVHAGEIVAIAGVEGNGQSELVNAITGLEHFHQGKILFNDIDVTKVSIHQKYENGMSHIPEDRHKHGLVLDFNVIDNVVLQNIDEKPFSNYGLLNKSAIQLYAQDIITKYDVRGANSGFAVARGLSGGNQQKLIIGRELSRKHKILVVVQPTRGLDVGAIEYIHTKILEEKANGNAILLVSYELEEIMGLADRIIVLHAGKISGEVAGNQVKREEIGLMMAGTYHQSSKGEGKYESSN
ncbi:ABC transporter ATP-binding protein [Spiroplasma eriocheiris]|uniref:Ribose/galactose ABC transporter ATP-binding protein n=1 Tax=Spiroplasma eriocheiris TaxID=315358 RepID=A0A0H3XGR5_9MOLU|nr:ABC transporter ATP-binding protein [Spiroplasma eriocheiris]AHF57212.1 ABC-type transport system ATP-binding protein [Spiroplasma eriocheiris CCTCC M 207170]AKM53678.1 ribose/galactose ABC transporter ATP-binding protein [Spiroplasma eriocheiris]